MGKTTIDESPYSETSLPMQLALRKLQEVDFHAQNQRTTLSRLKDKTLGLSESVQSKRRLVKVKQARLVNDTNSSLTFLSSNDDCV